MIRKLVGVLVVVCACEGGLVTQAAPRSGPRETGSSLEVHVAVDSADDSLAALLGWQGGVPGARVMVLRNGTAYWDTLVTDSLGRVSPPVGSGLYRVYAERFLTDDERALLGMPRVFGDGQSLLVAGETTVELKLYADRAGSLVLSEFGTGTPPPWETNGSYWGGLHFEVFNNGGEARYLDGLLFGATRTPYVLSQPTPCEMTVETRRDALGIHVAEVLAFPGAGTDFPIGPGETRVIAWQAIDHRSVHPTLLDLSGGDFEVAPEGTADNPDVPNMRDVGLRPFAWQNLLGSRVFFLATPQDPRALPVIFRSATGDDYVRVPRETLLDVAVLWGLWPARDAESPFCYPMISPVLHRYEGGFREIGFETDPNAEAIAAYQRRALRRSADGRIILFDTNTSAVDFEIALKTPGWVPEPLSQ